MQAKDIMTPNPVCCTRGTSLRTVAALMMEHDCGLIPVLTSAIPVGVITDRDIVCRTVAKGLNPLSIPVTECMTQQPISVPLDMEVEDCCRVLEDSQLRRLLVVDANGACVGILAQADIARCTTERDLGEVVREVSERSDLASALE